MKKTKMILCLVLVMILAAGALFAGGGAQPSAGASSAPAAAAAPSVTTMRWWTNDAHNKVEVDQLVEKFNAGIGAQKGIKVEYTVYGADWQTAMQMAIETGREPEVFKGISNMGNYQQAGKLLPWKEIPGIDDILKNQAPYHRNQASIFDGDIYSVVLYGWYSGFHYNKSLLQKAGYSAPPKTWKEFEEAAIKISKLEPGTIYGYAMPLVWSPDFTTWMTEYFAASSIGHLYYNATVDQYQFADFTPYFETLARIRDAGAMFPGMESLSDDQQRAYFADGKIGFIGGAGWNVGVLYDQFPFGGGESGKPNDPAGWDYAPMPVQDPNNVWATPVSAGASVFVSAQVRNDKDKLGKVGDVLRLATGDEIQILMMSNGKNIPLRADINAKATTSERFQWTTYGKVIGANAFTMPGSPHDYLAPEGANRVDTIAQILTGQVPIARIRATLEDLDSRYNAALKQAYDRNVIKRSDFFDPTLESRIKVK